MSDPTTGGGTGPPPEGSGLTLPGSVSPPEAADGPVTPPPAPVAVLGSGEAVTTTELEGMPWYEARVEVYVRGEAPGDEYGEGGDKLAHARAATQAPSFADAVSRLDDDLAAKWRQILDHAPLVDQPPSPEVLPRPSRWWAEPVSIPQWFALCLALIIFSLSALVVFG